MTAARTAARAALPPGRRALAAELRRAGRPGGPRTGLLVSGAVAAVIGVAICVAFRLASDGRADAVSTSAAALGVTAFASSLLGAVVTGGGAARDAGSGLLRGARLSLPDARALFVGRAAVAVCGGGVLAAATALVVGLVAVATSGAAALPGAAAAVPAAALTGGTLCLLGFAVGALTRKPAATQLTLVALLLVVPLVLGIATPLLPGPWGAALAAVQQVLPSAALGAATSYGSVAGVAAGLAALVAWAVAAGVVALLREVRTAP